jgi:hypothetical protein
MDKWQHRDAIRAARADGFEVDMENPCCGCVDTRLQINEPFEPTEDVRAWSDGAVEIMRQV